MHGSYAPFPAPAPSPSLLRSPSHFAAPVGVSTPAPPDICDGAVSGSRTFVKARTPGTEVSRPTTHTFFTNGNCIRVAPTGGHGCAAVRAVGDHE